MTCGDCGKLDRNTDMCCDFVWPGSPEKEKKRVLRKHPACNRFRERKAADTAVSSSVVTSTDINI